MNAFIRVLPATVLALKVAFAHADDGAPSMGNAVELLADGHALEAEAMLRQLAEARVPGAAERLAMWHLYGVRVLGPGPWRRSEAQRWLERAALEGSEAAGHLQAAMARARPVATAR